MGKKAFALRGELYSFDTIAISVMALQGRTPFTLENRDQVYISAQTTSIKIGGEVYAPEAGFISSQYGI